MLACTPRKTSEPGSPLPSSPQIPSAPTHQGTIDGGGGGNKICGRPIESFRKDIRDLPEYKKYVDPIFQYFVSPLYTGCDNCQTHNFAVGSHMSYMLFNKGWYVVPCPLSQLSKEKIGSVYDTEQVALQTFDDVWIDEEKFNALNESDRGLMLLHEIVMGMKILKWDSSYHQCAALAESNEVQNMCGFLYQKKRESSIPLTPTDYKEVRIVTNELFNNYKKYDQQLIKNHKTPNLSSNEMMRKYNFSNGYHIWRRSDSDLPLFTGEKLIYALTQSKFTRDMPKYSKHILKDKNTLVASRKCTLDFEYDEINKKIKMIFKVTSLNGKTIEMKAKKEWSLPKDSVLQGNYLDEFKDGNLNSYSEFSFPREHISNTETSLKLGDRTLRVWLQFDSASKLHAWELSELVCTNEADGKCNSLGNMNESKISTVCNKDEKIFLPQNN